MCKNIFSAVLSGVNHIFLFDAGKHLIHEFLTFDSGDAEVMVKVIAAHFGLCGRDFLVKIRHVLIAVLHDFRHILRFQIPLEDDIHPRAAAHGADIDGLFRPDGVRAEEGRHQVFNRVHHGGIHHHFAVGLLHADIEGRQNAVPDGILSGNINPAEQAVVVNAKACYVHFFHPFQSCFIAFHCTYFFTGLQGFLIILYTYRIYVAEWGKVRYNVQKATFMQKQKTKERERRHAIWARF